VAISATAFYATDISTVIQSFLSLFKNLSGLGIGLPMKIASDNF